MSISYSLEIVAFLSRQCLLMRKRRGNYSDETPETCKILII